MKYYIREISRQTAATEDSSGLATGWWPVIPCTIFLIPTSSNASARNAARILCPIDHVKDDVDGQDDCETSNRYDHYSEPYGRVSCVPNSNFDRSHEEEGHRENSDEGSYGGLKIEQSRDSENTGDDASGYVEASQWGRQDCGEGAHGDPEETAED